MGTIESAAREFLAEKRHEAAATTFEYYRMVMRNDLLPWCLDNGIDDLKDFTLDVWKRYRYHMEERPLKIETIRTRLRGSKVFLTWADVPVSKKWNLPKAPERLMDTLEVREVERLEKAADRERDKLIIRFLAETGVRISEMTGVRVEDLRSYNSPTRRYFIRVIGKGDKQRDVPIEYALFKRLKAFAEDKGPRDFIFTALGSNRRLEKWGIEKMFRTLKAELGIDKKCTPHSLRHAYITDALRDGMPAAELRRIVGHTTTAMIDRVYSHLNSTDLSNAYEAMLERRRSASGRSRAYEGVFGEAEPRRRRSA